MENLKNTEKRNTQIHRVSLHDGILEQKQAKEYYDNIVFTLQELGINLIGKKVLEIGSGNAVFLDYLRNQGVDAFGADVWLRGSKESPQVVAKIEQLPFTDESVDIVLSLGTVFDDSIYSQDQNKMMEEIARVLKHGGIYCGFGNVEKNKSNQINGFDLIPDVSNSFRHVYKKSY